jgi:hypothetical protein
MVCHLWNLNKNGNWLLYVVCMYVCMMPVDLLVVVDVSIAGIWGQEVKTLFMQGVWWHSRTLTSPRRCGLVSCLSVVGLHVMGEGDCRYVLTYGV